MFIHSKQLNLNKKNMRFEKHIFVCANQKAEGKPCCGNENGMAIIEKFRTLLGDAGLKAKIRVQKSGCLDSCSKGPALVIYPEGTYYGKLTLADVDTIFQEHILQNKVVEALELKF
jgi:(2Fe-2S) ferredoxin